MSTATLTQTTCYHCGNDCPEHPIVFDEKSFCCDGCKAVYEVLNANQLCQYYDLTQAPGQSPRIARLEFLDHPDIINQLLEFTDGTVSNVTFYVPSIHCSSCLYLLEHLYRISPAIRTSRVDFLKKHVHVTFFHNDISLRQVAELLTSLGYEPLISLNDVVKETEKPSYRPLLYKLAVAGFCAGNIMLFSFPEYLGLDDPAFQKLFGYLNLLLATPVVFYSGWGYFESVWAALRRKMINIDLPILVGILTAYGRTVYEVLSQTGAGFADSVTGLIFFLLIGKWFQQRTYDFLSFERDYKSYFPLAATRLANGSGNSATREESVPVASLKKGDRIRIRNQELIPADGILYKGNATIDYSFVTGESEPESKKPGTLLYAGGKQIGEAIELEVVREVSQSYLTQLWNNDAFRKGAQSRIRTFADAVGKYFTITVLTLAFLVGTYWYLNDATKAVNAFTAILIVACPCVLSLSYPFALGNGMRIFGKQKFYLKNADVLEQIAACDTIVFDKTGTLTSATATQPVEDFSVPLDEMDRSLVASLVQQSAHPLSRKLFTHLTDAMTLPVENFTEVTGQGIKGLVYGQFVKIGSRAFVHPSPGNGANEVEGSVVHISIDHIYRGCFRFPNQFRNGIDTMLASLKENHTLYLLSGDNDAILRSPASKDLKKWFSGKEQMVFDCHPQEKLDVIRSLQAEGRRVLMVGDGLNDAGGLKQADVGIAVTDDTIQFTPSSDAILEASALRRLPDFLNYSHFGMRLIRFSFAVSLIYNCIGLSFAVTGNLSPVVAAILMPLSSATMVFIATLGMRWKGAKMFPN
ncbi:heavy metal translocating P-type ATPase metal-binding domain-containing protein [Nibrella saemangeumensis]|uniref:Heavy metal translocating P-type ATPase metal-binding domain-containing protein n=1 Tax=Nibrella saemangeumensis TaxID=1084526 RepID=A0ABP8NFF5_9BACT